MRPAEVALHHLDEAEYMTRCSGYGHLTRYHCRLALCIIAFCSGGKTRSEAKALLDQLEMPERANDEGWVS